MPTKRQCLRLSRISVVAWGIVLSLLAYLAGRLVQNEGLLNLAYKVPVLTYGPMLMIALFALARRGSFPAILSGALASVGGGLTLLVLKGAGGHHPRSVLDLSDHLSWCSAAVALAISAPEDRTTHSPESFGQSIDRALTDARSRLLKTESTTNENHHTRNYDFVVIGGGLAGICAAVTAARQGIRTALVQDRPVLGGNASTEIRVPPVGATQCNFAYSRETGLIEELFLNNLHRNPTWCPEGWNLELETLVRNEPMLDLFLNSAVCEVAMNAGGDRVETRQGLLLDRGNLAPVRGPLFRRLLGRRGGRLAGRRGLPHGRRGALGIRRTDVPRRGRPATRMGMSLHMHARDAGRPMPFTLPAWVDMELNADDFGPYRPVCEHFFPDTGGFWWLEWGGALDTVHDTTKIKEEVQRITLAVWDYLKNRSPLAERLADLRTGLDGRGPRQAGVAPLRGRPHPDHERHRRSRPVSTTRWPTAAGASTTTRRADSTTR